MPSSASGLHGKITTLAQTNELPRPFVRPPAKNDVIHDLDLEELTGPDQVPRHFDVLLAGRGIAAGMVMLCDAPMYVQCLGVGPPEQAGFIASTKPDASHN